MTGKVPAPAAVLGQVLPVGASIQAVLQSRVEPAGEGERQFRGHYPSV